MLAQLSFFLGFIAILQMALLPGYLVIRLFRWRLPFLQSVSLCFVLSLLLNYIGVFILTALGWYRPEILRVIVAVEIIVALLLSGSVLRHTLQCSRLQDHYRQWSAQPTHITVEFIVKVVAWLVLAGMLIFWIDSWGDIFQRWDPAQSYDPWALAWAANHLPHYTYHYPQLMPANWSIAYVLMGKLGGSEPLQMFPHVIVALFPLLLLTQFVTLARQLKRPDYYLGLILTFLLLIAQMLPYLSRGYVDIPAAMFDFIAITQLLLAAQLPEASNKRRLAHCWFGLVAVIAGAATKQAGLYLAVLYPILVVWWVTSRQYRWPVVVLNLIAQYLLTIAIVAPWYGYAIWGIAHGINRSELPYVTQAIYQHRSDFWRALMGFTNATGLFWVMWLLAVWKIWRQRYWRSLYAVIVVPFTFIWWLAFDYDSRNLAILIPLLGAMSGCIVYQWVVSEKGQHFFQRCRHWRLKGYEIVIAVIVTAFVAGFFPAFQMKSLQSHLTQEQHFIGRPQFDLLMYNYLHINGFNGKILSQYPLLKDLPGIRQHVLIIPPSQYGINMVADFTASPQRFEATLKQYPQVKYVVLWQVQNSKIFVHYIKQQVKAGRLKLLLHDQNLSLYELLPSVENKKHVDVKR